MNPPKTSVLVFESPRGRTVTDASDGIVFSGFPISKTAFRLNSIVLSDGQGAQGDEPGRVLSE